MLMLMTRTHYAQCDGVWSTLQALRQSAGLSVATAAKRADMSRQYWHKIERGAVASVPWATIEHMYWAIGEDVNDYYDDPFE